MLIKIIPTISTITITLFCALVIFSHEQNTNTITAVIIAKIGSNMAISFIPITAPDHLLLDMFSLKNAFENNRLKKVIGLIQQSENL